jgi:hypothetical protein
MNWLAKGYEERFGRGVLLRPGFDALAARLALPTPGAPYWPARIRGRRFRQEKNPSMLASVLGFRSGHRFHACSSIIFLENRFSAPVHQHPEFRTPRQTS